MCVYAYVCAHTHAHHAHIDTILHTHTRAHTHTHTRTHTHIHLQCCGEAARRFYHTHTYTQHTCTPSIPPSLTSPPPPFGLVGRTTVGHELTSLHILIPPFHTHSAAAELEDELSGGMHVSSSSLSAERQLATNLVEEVHHQLKTLEGPAKVTLEVCNLSCFLSKEPHILSKEPYILSI